MEQAIIKAAQEGDSSSLAIFVLVALVIMLSQLILKIAEMWIHQKNKQQPTSSSGCSSQNQINALYDWHNVSAPNGSKIWYNDPETATAIKSNSDELRELTRVFKEMKDIAKRNTEALERHTRQS